MATLLHTGWLTRQPHDGPLGVRYFMQKDPVPEQSPYGVRSCPGGRIGPGSRPLGAPRFSVENHFTRLEMCDTSYTKARLPNSPRMGARSCPGGRIGPGSPLFLQRLERRSGVAKKPTQHRRVLFNPRPIGLKAPLCAACNHVR